MRLTRAIWDWFTQPDPARLLDDAEKARMVRNLLQPSTYRWTQEHPELDFNIVSELGDLGVIVTPIRTKQAAFYVPAERVLQCFDTNTGWQELEQDLRKGAVEAAKKEGLCS